MRTIGRRKQPIDLYIDCVVLSSFESEISFLRNVFRTSGIRIHHAASIDQADFLLTVTGSTVLMTDVIFDGGYWHSALASLAQSHPFAATLLIAEPVDRPYVAEAFAQGACGVIWKPFEFAPVMRQIRAVHEASKERRVLFEEQREARRLALAARS